MATKESARQFHFLREIASGGFGSVFLTKVIHGDGFNRLAAVKLLHQKWSENEEIASRMRDEARLLGWLRHKNIVDVMDLTMIDGRVAVIMEYLEAVDVKVVQQACRDTGAWLPVRAALGVCAAVASALDAAYNRPPYAGEKPLRVIHRDIKPSNIMIDGQGVVKVLDFGVARADFAERESRTQEMSFGSLEYMPPERLFFEPESPASDVYSLGATLFEMLALEKFGKAKLRAKEHDEFIDARIDDLYRARPIPEVARDPLADFLTEMLAFDAEDRPPAAECHTLMRSLARRIDEFGLEEWAENTIPPLLQAVHDRGRDGAANRLVGQTMSEDVRGFGVPPQNVRELGSSFSDVEDEGEDDGLDDTGRHVEARWNALKQATLAEMTPQEAAHLRPVLPQGGPPSLPPPPVARPIGASMPPMHMTHPGAPPGQFIPPAPALALPEEAEDEATGGGWGLIIGALLGGFVILGIGILALVVAVALTVGGAAIASQDPESTPAEVAEDGPAPKEEVAPKPPPITGPAARFTSALPGTTRMVVRCAGGNGEGKEAVDVGGKALGRCSVTAFVGARRTLAVVDDAQAKTYVCFAGGKRECKKAP